MDMSINGQKEAKYDQSVQIDPQKPDDTPPTHSGETTFCYSAGFSFRLKNKGDEPIPHWPAEGASPVRSRPVF